VAIDGRIAAIISLSGFDESVSVRQNASSSATHKRIVRPRIDRYDAVCTSIVTPLRKTIDSRVSLSISTANAGMPRMIAFT